MKKNRIFKVHLKNRLLQLIFFVLIVLIPSQFVSAQKSKASIKLGAYFYGGWSGQSRFDDGTTENAWAKGMPWAFTKKLATTYQNRMPLWGWRDETQELMEKQINLAADYGLSFFSFCWYWQDDKGPINVQAINNFSKNIPIRLFMQAKNNTRMEFCLMIANHERYEIVGKEAWKQAADYWIDIFRHPQYLKVNGKPLITIFIPADADKDGLKYLQEAAIKAGFPGVEIVGKGKGERIKENFTLWTNYNVMPKMTGISERHSFDELVKANVKEWYGSPEQPMIPVATIGWDRRPVEDPDGIGDGPNGKPIAPISWYFEKGTPKEFGEMLENMVHWMDEHPDQITKDRLAMIYAWNEMGEGGWLVPCKEDPDGAYLKVIRDLILKK
jgi:hypothetical protein